VFQPAYAGEMQFARLDRVVSRPGDATSMQTKQYLSRREASEYLASRGLRTAVATLAKYATIGGGPEFRSFGRFPRYEPSALDAWIKSKLTDPRRSTSDAGEGA
jgi:hypothetical protein